MKEVNLMEEHEKTKSEIEELENVEIPKWAKRRAELEKIIKQAKAVQEQKAEAN